VKSIALMIIPAITLIPLDGTADCVSRGFEESEINVMNAYIAYYGRPADSAGLAYWANRINEEGGDLSAIIDDFGFSQEYSDRFGSLSNTDLVTNLYVQLFNRNPDQAGLDFYVDELNSGRRSLQSISLDILNGAQNDDVTILTNRRLVSQHFVTQTEASNTQVGTTFYNTLMSAVTGSSSSTIAACDSTSAEIVAQGGILDSDGPVNIGDNRELSAGNGNCSSVKYPVDGTVVEYDIDSGNGITQMTTTTVSASQSLLEINSVITSSFGNSVSSSTSNNTFSYQTVDDYVFQTKVVTVSSSSSSSGTITSESTHAPPLMLTPATRWCEGQSWFRAEGEKTDTISSSSTGTNTQTSAFPSGASIVDSVNESVTVGAGTFSTVKTTTEFDGVPGGTGITWVDVVTGNIVLQKSYDKSDNLQSTTTATLIR